MPMIPKLAAAALAASLATAAVGAPASAPVPTDLKHPAGAIYASLPPGAFQSLYPDKAAQGGVSGVVQLRCLIGAAGQLKRCTILSEDPPGYGFAAAAAQLSAYFHARPAAADGERTAGKTVVIPIHFQPPPIPAANAAPAP